VSRDHLRDALLRRGRLNLAAGVASIVIGVRASSTALVGTGADVVADLVSSLVLIWRFRGELHGKHASHVVERRAHLVSPTALIVVAVGIGVAEIVRLASGEGASPEAAAIVASAASVVVLPRFAVVKYRIAPNLPSGALRMDGHITMVGTAMAAITLAGLALTSALGWSAADPIAALGVAVTPLAAGAHGLRDA
jgi:divalent metal cation (Fe/Co/Zn/Cd) transporter